ncbi:flagellar filament capping protein FliD [Halomonas sp. MCCC 1A11036]|uniref:Flagellar hook-associated protein 2 n=1 Tax=Billgrantia zhangzhouensis TaxID=2733481 RepID=A0ABS9ADT7_9GAMM|nr:flagellar filament capping protein FliD [Halomonas zhangzhouensis]MCE8019887.1 flagellar filament capping protein FliD [Halomonas zhangzhouensis]
MATIQSLGIGSGLDLNGLLKDLDKAERGKLEPIERQIETQQVKVSAYGKLEGALSAFQTAANALNDASLYQSLSTSVSGDAVQAAAGSDAAKGQYAVTVHNLATAGTLATARIDNLDDELIDGSETKTLTLNFAGQDSVDVDIEPGSTLEDIRDAINAKEDSGVSASVIYDGEGYRLTLSSTETGADASITGSNFADIVNATLATDEVAGEIAQQGQDASLEVNGIRITSASNQVEGAIQGVTLNLAEEGSSTVKVEQDTRAVREAITGFVDAFNSLKDTIDELTSFNSESGAAGDLLGDSAVRSIESRLRSVLSGGVAAEEGGFAMLGDIGISLKLDSKNSLKLEIDEERLDEVILNDQDALSAFFAGDSTTGGLAGQLSETITQLSGSNGALGGAKSGAENRIESLKERYVRMEQSIEATIARYRTQFGQLDLMIAQMNQTSDYLFQQFEMMNAQLGRN